MAVTSKRLFEITPRDWRDNDEVIARSGGETALIAAKGAPPPGAVGAGNASEGGWRRLFVEVDGDPSDAGVRDAVFYALGIGRPRN